VKLTELKKPLNESMSDDTMARAKQDYADDVTKQLTSLIAQAIQMGVVDPNLPPSNTSAPNTATTTPAATPAQPAAAQNPTPVPNVAQQAAQTRQQKQAAAAQAAQTQMAQNATTAPNVAQQAAQTRQQKQAAAAQSAQTQMAQNPVKPKVWKSGRNPTGPSRRNASANEHTRFDRLNALLENIININEANAPISISDFVQSKIGPITKSKIFNTSPYKEEVQKISDAIQSSYAQDKGQVGIQALVDYTWNMLINGRRGRISSGSATPAAAPATATAAPAATATAPAAAPATATAAPAGTTAPAASPEAAAASKVGVRQINKIIPTLRKRDLLSVKKNVDNTLNSREGGTASSTTAPADAGASAFGQMANTLSGANASKSSTGGTTTKTPTGLVHTAKPQAAATAAPEKDNIISMPKGRTGRVRASREGGVTPEEQAKFDEKVRQAMANQK
jgi:hypothetical protein